MRVYHGPTAVALGVVLLSGCAARRSGELSARGPSRASTGVTVEASDHRLAAALLAERVSGSADSQLRVAQEYHRLGILDSAHTRLERALAREPRFAAAHEEMARVWRDWGLPESGLGYAYRAVRYDAQSASARNTLGTLLDALGRLDEARAAYEGALTLDPTAGWALNNLCYIEFRLGHFEDARRQCEAAIRVSPALGAAHNNLGLTHAASGDLLRAREAFLAAGDEATAHYNLGIVHLAHRSYLAAALEFEQAIRARPTFTSAKTRAHDARMRVLTTR